MLFTLSSLALSLSLSLSSWHSCIVLNSPCLCFFRHFASVSALSNVQLVFENSNTYYFQSKANIHGDDGGAYKARCIRSMLITCSNSFVLADRCKHPRFFHATTPFKCPLQYISIINIKYIERKKETCLSKGFSQ
ncbi:hypothetical protein BC829DRAFT_197494 [Chytridium lagenaria]|nr:hypothetical protein BC829DRAFT_197494 [Chytridium lagenaria]